MEPPGLFSSLFISHGAYKRIANDFHPYHRHDFNTFLHVITTTLGVWGGIQLALYCSLEYVVALYTLFTMVTTPIVTSLIHTAIMAAIVYIPYLQSTSYTTSLLAMAAGYGFQDLAHYLTGEPTYMGSYMYKKPLILLFHTVWLLPLVIDSFLIRQCFLPWFVPRNRTITCTVVNKRSISSLRKWLLTNVPETKVTTHIWPHKHDGTSLPTKTIEDDTAIYEAFRSVFPAKHYDVSPVVGMNEIYVTAVGAKKEINSDAVFYTPHTDSPYWWLPGASLYRVLVGITPNKMVRTRFNMQHSSCDKIIDVNEVLGFDYNRELHWIDHTDETNDSRRSLLKLHYVVYPKGWHRYGTFCGYLNESYHTWARGNFLQTLNPTTPYDFVVAYWIWVCTWCNAAFVLNFGWNNLVYFLCARAFGTRAFLVLTSFRHYVLYITTFGYRRPAVAYGDFVKDCKIYKTVALFHLVRMMYPKIDCVRDVVGVLCVAAGYVVTLMATYRLGFVRTYFGSELGFVKPKWITGFPYGYIPHPMIVGQLFALGNMLLWWGERMELWEKALVAAHMGFYTTHMVQEMLYSDY